MIILYSRDIISDSEKLDIVLTEYDLERLTEGSISETIDRVEVVISLAKAEEYGTGKESK